MLNIRITLSLALLHHWLSKKHNQTARRSSHHQKIDISINKFFFSPLFKIIIIIIIGHKT